MRDASKRIKKNERIRYQYKMNKNTLTQTSHQKQKGAYQHDCYQYQSKFGCLVKKNL